MSMEKDLEVYTNTRFSNGMWRLKDDVAIHWASEAVKTENRKDSIYSLVSTKVINHRGDTLNTPTISLNITSPIKDVVGVEAYHFIGGTRNKPRFQINSSNTPSDLSIETSDTSATLSSGDLTAEINTTHKSFGIDFKSSNKSLTKLGFRSLGYVEDSREHTGTARPFMTAQLHLSVREKVYGLGERFGPLIKNGQRVDIWHEDGGTSSDQGYKNIPFYLTDRGYGIFVDSTSQVVFDVQAERTTRVNVTVPGQIIRFYVIYGPTPKDILSKYNILTGKPALPPPWTFGLWLSTSFTTNYDIGTVSSFIQGMKDRDIPLSTFHFDCFWMKGFQWCDFEFDSDNFPEPAAILKGLKEKFGIRVCVWLNSYIAQESKLFEEGEKGGFLIKKTNGDPYQTDAWQAGMGLVDFTNPAAVTWYKNKLIRLVKLGVDCFKTDFGEKIPVKDVKYFDGSDPTFMHNYYTYLYNKCVFEVLESEIGTHQACLFARSATTGGQKFPVHWGGDCMSTYEAMAESLRGGLSLTLSGFSFWSHDIGGFEGDPEPAVYKRWVAFGLLSSHSRLHGSGSYRVPWAFDDEASVVLKKFTNLKLSLMPYIYAASVEAHDRGVSVMRATFVEFPEDPSSWTADTQFILGDNLLVAPVFDGEAGEVTYYVPNTGSDKPWYGYLDGKLRDSGKWATETHNFQSLPLLVKPNSVIITGSTDSTPEYEYNKGFTVNVYEASGQLEAKIPHHKELGTYVATINVKAGDSSLEISSSGDVSDWNIKILGSKIGSVTGGTVIGDDSLGNSIIKASAESVVVSLA